MDDDFCFYMVKAGWQVAFLCFILLSSSGEILKKSEIQIGFLSERKVSEIQITEAVTKPSNKIYLFLIPLSAMGCTYVSIKHYLDMFLRA